MHSKWSYWISTVWIQICQKEPSLYIYKYENQQKQQTYQTLTQYNLNPRTPKTSIEENEVNWHDTKIIDRDLRIKIPKEILRSSTTRWKAEPKQGSERNTAMGRVERESGEDEAQEKSPATARAA